MPVAFCASVWAFARVKSFNRRDRGEMPEYAQKTREFCREDCWVEVLFSGVSAIWYLAWVVNPLQAFLYRP